MKRSKGKLALSILMVSLILLFIWGNSLLPAELSQAFSDWVKNLLTGGASGEGSGGSGLLRKIAHFTEFAALGMSLGWLFGMLRKNVSFPFLMGAAAACVDETIQLFVPERGPGIFDVCLDTAGVAVGLLALHIGYKLFKKKNNIILEEN